MIAGSELPLFFEATLEIKKIFQQLRHRQILFFVTCHKLHVHKEVYTPTLFSAQTCCYVTDVLCVYLVVFTVLIRE